MKKNRKNQIQFISQILLSKTLFPRTLTSKDFDMTVLTANTNLCTKPLQTKMDNKLHLAETIYKNVIQNKYYQIQWNTKQKIETFKIYCIIYQQNEYINFNKNLIERTRNKSSKKTGNNQKFENCRKLMVSKLI